VNLARQSVKKLKDEISIADKKIKESEYLSDITKYLKVSVKRIA